MEISQDKEKLQNIIRSSVYRGIRCCFMIKFKSVRWKNLLSTGNQFTEIFLDNRKATLILGENGSGKSTMLDALCFGLFGKGFRKISKNSLINSVNQRGMVVEVEFAIGSKQYRVVRGAKPNVFEIFLNDRIINQDANMRDYQEQLEKQILKLKLQDIHSSSYFR